MKLTFINVGYGDSILIEQEDKTILIDGGSMLSEEFEGFPCRIRTKDYLEKKGIKQIDLAIITHIHDDHVGGMTALQIPIKMLWIPFEQTLFMDKAAVWPDDSAAQSVKLFSGALNLLADLIKDFGASNPNSIEMVEAGKVVHFGDLTISILAPFGAVKTEFVQHLRRMYQSENPTAELTWLDAHSNATSLIVKLELGENSILLPADNVPSGWNEIDFSLLKNVNVLKLPHHGQIDSISEKIMKKMPLQYIITTASSDKRYNSANAEVYWKLLRWHPDIQFLFSDEREYLPFFSKKDDFIATTLIMDSEGIRTEFVIEG